MRKTEEALDAETAEAYLMLVRLAEERGVEKLSDLGDLPPLSAAERWRLTRPSLLLVLGARCSD